MSFMIAAAATVAAGTIYNGYQSNKNAKKQLDQQKQAATEQAAIAREQAAQEKKAADDQLAFQQQQERIRQEATRAQEAEQRRQAADAATAGLSADANEPVVQLATTAPDGTNKSKRRAQFRPDYASGVSI